MAATQENKAKPFSREKCRSWLPHHLLCSAGGWRSRVPPAAAGRDGAVGCSCTNPVLFFYFTKCYDGNWIGGEQLFTQGCL